PGGVLYVPQKSVGAATFMIPLHKEVIANDCLDLFMLQLTQKFKDQLNEGPPSTKGFHPENLMYVFLSQRRSNANLELLKKDFLKPLVHLWKDKFWNVNKICLVQRTMIENQLLLIQDSEPHLRSAECVASGINQIIRDPFTLIRKPKLPMRNDTLAWATISEPPFDSGRLL
ncbi:unnamed protein product, partial [Caenorhabditis brenneri]